VHGIVVLLDTNLCRYFYFSGSDSICIRKLFALAGREIGVFYFNLVLHLVAFGFFIECFEFMTKKKKIKFDVWFKMDVCQLRLFAILAEGGQFLF
jgi:hypothetical protein